MSAARAGDQAAWRELYALHHRRLTVWLRSLSPGDAVDSADDLAADAWLLAAEKLGGFVGSDDDFAGWLFTLARNLAANSQRKAGRRRTDATEVEPSAEMWGLARDDIALVDEQDATRALLSHLSSREAEVVACIDVVGLDVASTARALGMKPTAVRVARHRALVRLRKILSESDL
ncbi:RNA polymerase sigma factor [Nocardioides sp. URHA0020]|uniref:RNA polymerase sigma factor n=1 Tax=Nocardioides sp. URHA0020 TaxID=1380392 RepID=UPI00068628D2|nr:sigma-70 family RNA polymerase sigma factor [Nocardioides sp. URHA0020]